jgi:hypothetical protein
MDALRYIIQELPDNPDNVVSEVYFSPGESYTSARQDHLPWELRDNMAEDIDWYEDSGGNT